MRHAGHERPLRRLPEGAHGVPAEAVHEAALLVRVPRGQRLPNERVDAETVNVDVVGPLRAGEELGDNVQLGPDRPRRVEHVFSHVDGRAVTVVEADAIEYSV